MVSAGAPSWAFGEILTFGSPRSNQAVCPEAKSPLNNAGKVFLSVRLLPSGATWNCVPMTRCGSAQLGFAPSRSFDQPNAAAMAMVFK